jgi:hypothetical protein
MRRLQGEHHGALPGVVSEVMVAKNPGEKQQQVWLQLDAGVFDRFSVIIRDIDGITGHPEAPCTA